ncbi:MAG: DoxX-like family protein [Proteobacteria bacterium]|nr:DoxX-like family protein [Pseudomonadota bacterium]
MNTVQLARYTIGCSWIYNGLFPKLVQLSPLEMIMSGSIGLTEENTLLLIRFSGVAEILFGIAFIVFYRIGILVMLNIAGLVGLLVFVLVMTPSVLIEAFNPVTTNIPLIVLSIVLLRNEKQHRQTG